MRAAAMKAVLCLSILAAFTFLGGGSDRTAQAADEYDAMRDKWRKMLTGEPLDPADADVSAAVAAQAAEANGYWQSMNKSATRTHLWSDIPNVGHSVHIRTAYERLRAMALAYSTPGSALAGDPALAADIVGALDYMYATRYHEFVVTTPSGTSNWWDWEIGIPMALNDTAVLMYDLLSGSQIANYTNAVERFSPVVNKTGANRAWKGIVVGVRGVIAKDGVKLADARDGLSPIFNYVTSGDGFYADGSFIQHGTIAYTGGYGIDLLQAVGDLMALLHGTAWQVTDPDQANVWQWVHRSYRPVIYKGAMMDMVRGREISRHYRQDHAAGHAAIQGILRLAEIAPAADAEAFKSMVKGWILADGALDFLANAPLKHLTRAKALLADPAVAPASEQAGYAQFSRMDKAVQVRPGYGFGLAMYSSRTSSYEAINSENGRGWYTSAGTTYLYNGDQNQYSGDYWPTVDAYRLPGTTVLSGVSATPHLSANNWTGGTALLETYGVSGMDLNYAATTLTAKKSWFMFDDEIVALGAGIASSDGVPVETIVENRKIGDAGTNALTVDGALQPSGLGWSQTLTGVQWAHLAGSAPGADIGYYFPQSADLAALREARTGNWKQINNRPVTPAANVTRNYVKLWMNHGANPAGAGYQYVLLPNKTSAEVGAYAANPNIEVLENSASVQAVKEKTLGIVGANFWTDAPETADFIAVNKKASVMTREQAGEALDVAISDPTQANAGTIEVELARAASGYAADPGITVTQLAPTIKFTVNVNQARGKTFKASFDLSGAGQTLFVDDFHDGNADGWTPTSGTWTVESGVYSGTAGSSRSYSVAGDAAWTDYALEAKVNVTNNAGGNKDAGLVFRYADPDNFYALYLKNDDRTGRKMELAKFENGVQTSLGFANPSIAPDTFYTYKIVVDGDVIEAYQDGVLQVSATDSAHAAGKIGARVYASTKALFDDIAVTSLP